MSKSKAAFKCVWFAALVAAVVCFLSLPASAVDGERRLALVIGNNAYATQPLDNAINDSREMAKALQSVGFEVIRKENLGAREFRATLRDFAKRVQIEEGIALVYYAGHGVQISGRNYLVPVDAALRDEDEVKDESVDIDDTFLSRIEKSRKRLTMVVLDACRNNPFRRGRSGGGGLATMDAPRGTLIAFATSPGKTADDGSGANSIYTGALARAVIQEGLPVEQVFKRAGLEVAQLTRNQQVPWISSNFFDDFFFKPLDVRAKRKLDEATREADIEAAVSQAIAREAMVRKADDEL